MNKKIAPRYRPYLEENGTKGEASRAKYGTKKLRLVQGVNKYVRLDICNIPQYLSNQI